MLLPPVIWLTASLYRVLQLYAPTNRLVARVRAGQANWRTAGAVLLVALLLATAAGELGDSVAAGGPSWLQLLAGIAGWDAIKLGTLSIHTASRAFIPRPRPPAKYAASDW